MRKIFQTYRVEIVFHAAAYKHVPVMESNVDEAVSNNVFGLLALLNVAAEFHLLDLCDDFVRQSREPGKRYGLHQAGGRIDSRRLAGEADALCVGPLRQCPRIERQRASAFPGTDSSEPARHHHAPGNNPVLS